MAEPTPILTVHDGSFYSADWRYQLALALAEDSAAVTACATARQDALVKQAVKLIQGKPGRRNTPAGFDQEVFRFVQLLGTDGPHRTTGQVLEALLLTEAPMDAIAKDMGLDTKTVWLYERLFFNVRDEEGGMSLSPVQRQFFATEGTYKPTDQRPEYLMWRRVAVSAGYPALVKVLEIGPGCWQDAELVDLVKVTSEMAQAETLSKVAAGGLNLGQLGRLESMRLKDKMIRHQTGEAKIKDEGMELVRKIMEMMAPKMVEQEKINQARAAMAAENLHKAEQSIQGTRVNDRGVLESHEAMNQAIQEALSPLARKSKEGKGLAEL